MSKLRKDLPFDGHCWPVRIRMDRITERSEYRRQRCLEIDCTILGVKYPPAERERIEQEWCDFFRSPNPVRELSLWRRVSVPLFEAVCEHRPLRRLYVKWGPVADLSALRNLSDLEGLSLGTTSVEDLSPLAALPRLTHLQLDNLKQVVDFSELARCRRLEFLNIEGYPQGPQKIKIENLRFLRELTGLRALRIGFASIQEFDVNELLTLTNLEYLHLPCSSRAETRLIDEWRPAIRDALPKLRFGNVVKQPDSRNGKSGRR